MSHKHFRWKRYLLYLPLLLLLLLLAAGGYALLHQPQKQPVSQTTIAAVESYAKNNGLSLSDYPNELLALLSRNPETKQFVLDYPLCKNTAAAFEPSDFPRDTVPLLLQWDERWGYYTYADSILGINGCGPTCLSMVSLYLTESGYGPAEIADYAQKHGYYSKGNGTKWTLMSEGSAHFGLHAEELPLDEGRMRKALEADKLIICAMGPGDFTTTGHYIVLTGYENGSFSVNDPNSNANSEKRWTYDRLKGQIRNIWAFTAEEMTE